MVPSLHEIKIISSCPTRYAPHRRGQEATKAVDVRANQLHQSYVAKARATDQTYCGTPDGEMGPVERKLATMGEVKGLVVGAFGEVSADTHALISHLARSRVQVARPQLGRRGQLRSEEAEITLYSPLHISAELSQSVLQKGRPSPFWEGWRGWG